MNIKSKYTSAILAAGLLTTYSASPIVSAVSFKATNSLNEELSKKVSVARASFDSYKTTGDIESLKKSIIEFGNIAEFIKEEKEIQEDASNEIYKLFLEQREELYLIANAGGSTQYIIDYADSILNGWKKNRNMTIYTRIFLEEGLIDYNKGKLSSIDEELGKIKDYYYFLLESEWENPDGVIDRETYEEMQDQITETPPGSSAGPPPVYDEGFEPAPPTYEDMGEYPDFDEVWGEDYSSTDSYYQKDGSKCMLITRVFKKNMLIETKKQEVSKDEYVYCGIYDYIFEDTFVQQEVEIDKEYITTDQNIESNKYIYYTVNKDTLNPYYYNTGIRATIDGKVTYNQLKDVLYQISIKTKGFSTDSNTKSLSIIEGKPIVLSNEQEFYSKEQVESMLDKFKYVDIKIQEYSDESTSLNDSLFSHIKENSSVDLIVDGETISVTGIDINNSTLIISLNEAAQILGLKVQEKSGTYSIEGDSNYIRFTVGSLSYRTKSNQEKKFASKPIKKNNEVYIDLKVLCEEMGYTIDWDSESLSLNINKKEKN